MKKIFINSFIILNLVAIPIGKSTYISKENVLKKIVTPYLVWTRLLQNWPLFVPTPRTYAIKYRAEIKFKDGTVQIWQRPYPPNWDFFERHLAYSFQKWDLASNYLEKHSFLREDLIRYLKIKFNTPQNPVQSVSLIRATAPWPPPAENGYVMPDESKLVWEDAILQGAP